MLERVRIFALSMLGYIVAGQIGLLLSIPPGFASAVWPATGVALALALRFPLVASVMGSAAGSFVINLAIATDNYSHLTLQGMWLAFGIGLAALLQTLVGVWLFRRCIGDFVKLMSPQFIARFVLIVASAGYTVSATISTLVLWLAGVVPGSIAGFTWLTWWVGDSLGTLFFTPFVLTLLSSSVFITRKQKVQILVPILIICVCIWAVFSSSLEQQNRNLGQQINLRAGELAEQIIDRLQLSEHFLKAYEALINSSQHFDQEQFNQFSAIMIKDETALSGVGWTEIVTRRDRALVEQSFRDEGYHDYHFTQLTPTRELVVAEEQEEYYPVLYIYPMEGNERAFGLNLAAEPIRRSVLMQAKELRKAVATAPLTLAQGGNKEKSFIIYKPVFSSETDAFLGYVSGVVRIENLLGQQLQLLKDYELSIALVDVTDPLRPMDLIRQDNVKLNGTSSYFYSTQFGERSYQIEFFANSHYPLAEKDWASWGVLTGGFLIAALTQMFILAVMGSHTHIRHEVAVKTRDLQVQTELAQEASKAKTEFLSNMSHELRTPLNAIIGLINLCLKTTLDARQEDYLQKAAMASSTLLSLINQTLDHAKIEAGRMELSADPFKVSAVLEKLAAVFDIAARDKGVELRVQVGAGVPNDVIGDQLRIEQILINLLGNALKFTQQGSITLRLNYQASQFLFDVYDTGIGISDVHKANLFAAFNQGDNSTSRRFGGTGLGLTISRKLATLMRGNLKLVTTSEKGSHFRLILPLRVIDFEEKVATPALSGTVISSVDTLHTPAISVEKPLLDTCILLVEDIPLNQFVAEALLEDFGATVVVANNGEEAIEQLQQHSNIDLVLMDIQMPVMDGYEASRRIRQMPSFASLPILAMTANAMEQDIQAASDAGMNDHISKPIDAAVLLAKIQRHRLGG